MADSRRRACHTMATNMAAMSGTSVISSNGCVPRVTSNAMSDAVDAMTAARVQTVGPTLQTRKPYRIVRLTQMKWKGTVSHVGKVIMPARFAKANRPQATSIQ